MINIMIPANAEIPKSSQLIGVFPKIAARAALITPVIGFKAKIHE